MKCTISFQNNNIAKYGPGSIIGDIDVCKSKDIYSTSAKCISISAEFYKIKLNDLFMNIGQKIDVLNKFELSAMIKFQNIQDRLASRENFIKRSIQDLNNIKDEQKFLDDVLEQKECEKSAYFNLNKKFYMSQENSHKTSRSHARKDRDHSNNKQIQDPNIKT